jgi:AbrB family looped-hinge helix DNA binding protein
MAAVKIGASRQVVIPKKIHDALGLSPGDYLEVDLDAGRVVLTPKTLVDKAPAGPRGNDLPADDPDPETKRSG